MKIKGLDFIRVFGIFLVLSYHFFPAALPAGFLGVNILFVLSGFLISFHLIDEIYKNKTIDLRNFYFKRFIRIFPPILLMLFLTTLFSMAIDKDYTVRYFDQFLSAFSFNYNYFEILRGGSYEGQFVRQLFMHTWSLAIEVHFYILWPLLLLLICKKSLGVRAFKRKFSSTFMDTCLILYLVSYILMIILTLISKVSTGFVYFFDLTRMGSFVMGSMLAAFVKRFSFKKIPYNKMTLISVGLISILALVLSYESKATYIIGFLLTDIISSFMILIAYSNKDLYEDKIMARLSDYSYGMYVFHWPSFVIMSSFLPDTKGLLLSILITLILVLFNYHIFEPIFNNRQIRPISKSRRPRDIDYGRYRFLIQAGLVFSLIMSFSLAYTVSKASDDMVSLEKQILRESIIQDIDKIKLDKSQVDELIAESNQDLDSDDAFTNQADTPSITMLGDSVVLGNRELLQDHIKNLYINAEGSRPLENAPELIKQMESEGNLGDIVVIALGTNAETNPNESLKQLVKALSKGKRLILVTCYDNRYEQPHRVSKAMKKISKKYDFVTIMHWEKEAIAHPEYYTGTDGVHFYGNNEAYESYLKLLKKAINQSLNKKAKGE
ncbi:acyltransferase family protein [uncultured Anaerococcus sp.]|uniref:acyltransferase family protein n=1 Tax=uncultured Anaerococcus sp. TaxID=293428 RepID=UPI0026136DD4|nr:acyltransferase family protein [uncultured Anaerococcus sp.]